MSNENELTPELMDKTTLGYRCGGQDFGYVAILAVGNDSDTDVYLSLVDVLEGSTKP